MLVPGRPAPPLLPLPPLPPPAVASTPATMAWLPALVPITPALPAHTPLYVAVSVFVPSSAVKVAVAEPVGETALVDVSFAYVKVTLPTDTGAPAAIVTLAVAVKESPTPGFAGLMLSDVLVSTATE